jgi:hypothetical protein
MARKHTSPKQMAAKAARMARRQQVGYRRTRGRRLTQADLITREFNSAGSARQVRAERSPQ